MKKLLTVCATIAALLGLGIGALSLPWRAERPATPRLLGSCRGAGPLEAGAAEVLLDPLSPMVIGGFPRLSWTASGQRDPVAARALVAAEPGCAVGFVSVEILLVPGPLARAVEERVRDLGLFRVVVAATHTHAGPGGYWDSFLAGRVATGPFDERAFARLADAMAEALRRAHAARRPARLETGLGDVRDLAHSRAESAVDGRLVSLRFAAADGAPIGEIALCGIHPTLLGKRNTLVSGDWPGALMRSSRTPLLFFQGALGDQTTRVPAPGGDEVASFGLAVARRLDGLLRSGAESPPLLAASSAAIGLPPPSPRAVPRWLRRAAGTLFAGALPDSARVDAVRLGSVLLLAVPAEPVEAVGSRWRSAAGPGSEILSLAGDYAGYVETAERTARDEGEAVRTYYGPFLAERLESAVIEAAAAVR